MARFIYKTSPNDGAYGPHGKTLQAVHDTERQFAEDGKAKELIDPNRQRIDDIIAREIRPEVRKILNAGDDGKLAEALHEHDTKTKHSLYKRSFFGRLFGTKLNKQFLKEQPPLHGDTELGESSVEISANREVLAPVLYDAEKVWQNPILKDVKVSQFLRKYVANESLDSPENDPVLTYALGFFFENVHGGAADLNAAQTLKFLKKMFGVLDAHHDLEEMKSDFEAIKHEYGEIQEVIKKIEQIQKDEGNKSIADILKDYNEKIDGAGGAPGLKKKMDDAEAAVDTLEGKVATGDPKNAGYAALQRQAEVARKTFEKAKEEHGKVGEKKKSLTSLTGEFGHARHELHEYIHAFNHHELLDGSHPLAADELHTFEAFSHETDSDKAMKLFKGKTSLQKNWKTFTKNGEKVLKEVEESGGHEHEVHKASPQEFLHRLYATFMITKGVDGGAAKNTDPVDNPVYIRKIRDRAAELTRISVSDAKDMLAFSANRVRAEALAKNLPKNLRAKFIPDFNAVLHALRFMTYEEARPFAKLNLKKDMSQMDFRKMIKSKELSVKDLPILVAHLKKILEGHENTYIKPEDVPLVVAMIRNIRIVQAEMDYEAIMKKPGKFDDKLKEYLKMETASDEAMEKIDQSLLFSTITHSSILGMNIDSKVVKEHKKAMIAEMQQNVKEGKIPVDEAIKMMKEQGVETGYGTWAKFMGIRTGQNIGNIWKNTIGRGPFAWAWRSVKASGSWIKNSWLGKFVSDSFSYSFNPKTMGSNYSIIPPIFKGGAHGHGGGAHEEKH